MNDPRNFEQMQHVILLPSLIVFIKILEIFTCFLKQLNITVYRCSKNQFFWKFIKTDKKKTPVMGSFHKIEFLAGSFLWALQNS